MNIKQSDNLILKYIYLLVFSVSIISFFIIFLLWTEYKHYSNNSIAVTEYHIASIQYIDEILNEIESTRFWFRENYHDEFDQDNSNIHLPNQNHINNLINILNINMQNIEQAQIKFNYSTHENTVQRARQQFANISDYLTFLSLMEKKGNIANFDHEIFDNAMTPLSISLIQLKKLHSITYKQLIDINSNYNLNNLTFILFLLITLIFIGTILVLKIMSMISKFLLLRAQAENSLIDSEKRYRDFIETSNDWVWECDQNEITTYSNTAIMGILGYHQNELIGKPYTQFMHEESRADIERLIPKCIATKRGWHNKLIRWKSKTGEWYFLESSSVVKFDDNGDFSGFRGVDRDVTLRVHAEQAHRKSLQILNSAFDATPDGVSITRLSDGVFIYANQALARLSKFSLDEIIGKSVVELNFYHDPEARINLIRKLNTGKQISDFQTEFLNKDGEIIPGSISCSLVDIDDDKCIITILRDITERKTAESELRKLSTALEQSHDAVFITDLKGNIEYANSRLLELTGYNKEELIGNKPNIWKSVETSGKIYTDLWKTILEGKIWRGEILNRKKDGNIYWSSDIISPIFDKDGNTTHFLGSQEDITEIRNLNQQLTWQASYDSLTGLINRREFERRLERIVINSKKNIKGDHALFFMDLDQFKVVNDTCGHTAGDELLRQLSEVLQSKVRKRDTLARIGGDEFAVLMEHCSLDHAYRVANSLLDAVQEYHFQWDNQVFRVGVSIGLIPITDKDFSTTELLKNADGACYIAKEQGRNRIHVYHNEDEDLARRHGEMSWVAKLYQALDENRFCFYAQTITSLQKGKSKQSTSYEMLLRMIDDTGKIVTPEQFFPAAERYNLATKLDQWVIQHIFETLKNHPGFLQDIEFICINLSGFSLTDKDLLDYIISHVLKNAHNIDSKKLCFEITETAAITNLSNASKFISKLREMGCKFALDDFGSGLSSFGYLKNLPVDYLKIDGMFVKDIADDPIDHAMVKSINEIGHVMGMDTIAEYVENDEIKGMLREIGVDYAQGYGISIPVSLDELLKKHEMKKNNIIELKPPGKTA
jgi:diguanylate cyclase (GGDEF)-like protein/PAS domain S-box-containing protein